MSGNLPFISQPGLAAELAGLRYVNDGEPGYARQRRGQGFSYLDLSGKRVTDPAIRMRLESLVIPPAWTEVWICADEQGHIQATGRDEKGRKQYIYHPEWDKARNLNKFNRMLPFSELLPDLRQRIDQDLRQRTLTREKVAALVVRLMEQTLIRIGNPEYARHNSSYGLTTLQDEHIQVNGGQLHFLFTGKSGKEHAIDLQDRRLARLVKRCQELPGQQLFQYLGPNGECCQAITSGDINAYLREITGQDFSAKDFRTWGGSVRGAEALYALGPAENQRQTRKNVTQAIKQVAFSLGNTPTVCRKYYVHPEILAAYEDRTLFPVMEQALAAGSSPDPFALSPEETAVTTLLSRRM